jgi:hypothetical protein
MSSMKRQRADTRMLLRSALEKSGHLKTPLKAEEEDARVTKYEGWSAVMRVLAAVHDISSSETMMPALDGFLLDRTSISHRRKEVRRPVCHLLFACQAGEVRQYEGKVGRATSNVLTKEKGLMLRVHATEQFLLDHKHRLSTLFPVYLTIDIKGLCPSVLKPTVLRRALARLRHPIKGYGDYPKGPGWS